ncbi:MAG: class I SAM-dependent methyltransferase [Promethearchaeota archaeon]
MNLIADAIVDYHSNNLKSKFMFYRNCLQKKYNGLKNEFDLKIYFREYSVLFPVEKKLIDLSYGNILDIGACTGYYYPYLTDKGNITGIEISPKLSIFYNKSNIDFIIGDIFKYKFTKKFDTIILIGNDIALSGTIYNLKRLIKKFGGLLSDNGQILLIINHIRTLKYWHVVFTPQYNGKFGIPAKYLFLNVYFFKKLVSKYGFQSSILNIDYSPGNPFYLVRLVKS